MALANKTDLVAAVADWLNRQDLTARIPDFVTLAETDLNRTLRVQDMIVRATAAITEQYTAMPLDYLKMQYLQMNTSKPYEVEFRTPEVMRQQRRELYSVAGEPKIFTTIGSTLELAPTPDIEYVAEMAYFGKIPALTDDNPTNWLLTKHPDVYLYGTLIHSAPFLKDDERLAGWVSAYDRLVERIRMDDESAKTSGSTPRAIFRRLG